MSNDACTIGVEGKPESTAELLKKAISIAGQSFALFKYIWFVFVVAIGRNNPAVVYAQHSIIASYR
jgi:hypothetical protein